MKLLLDTHALLWLLSGDKALSAPARKAIEDEANSCASSIGSMLEIAIKLSLGKLRLDFPLAQLPDLLAAHDVELWPVNFQHTLRLSELPFHHRDPFDRLLVAQALVDDLVIITTDSELEAYGIKRLW